MNGQGGNVRRLGGGLHRWPEKSQQSRTTNRILPFGWRDRRATDTHTHTWFNKLFESARGILEFYFFTRYATVFLFLARSQLRLPPVVGKYQRMPRAVCVIKIAGS